MSTPWRSDSGGFSEGLPGCDSLFGAVVPFGAVIPIVVMPRGTPAFLGPLLGAACAGRGPRGDSEFTISLASLATCE